MRLSALDVAQRRLDPRATLLVQHLKFFVAEVFDGGKLVLGAFYRQHELGKLELYRKRVAVLRVLDQEHHQEGDDGSAGIDDELPGVTEIEEGTRHDPNEHDCDGPKKCQWIPVHKEMLCANCENCWLRVGADCVAWAGGFALFFMIIGPNDKSPSGKSSLERKRTTGFRVPSWSGQRVAISALAAIA